MSVTKSAHI